MVFSNAVTESAPEDKPDISIEKAEDAPSCENESSHAGSNEAKEDKLKALRGWNEIAEKAAAGDMAVLPFLKMAKVFTDSRGKIYVRYPNDFAKNMVDNANMADSIHAAICLELKRDIAPNDLVFGILEGTEDLTEFDDLII